MDVKIRLSVLREAGMRCPLAYQEMLAAGNICGTELRIDKLKFDELNRKHFGERGLGNVIHDALAPAVALVDKVVGTDLANCNGCAERRLKLNT